MMKKILSFVSAVLLLNISAVYADNATVGNNVSCQVVGERVAKEQGGNLKSATAVVEKGKNMCLVIVIVPSQNGEKPRRVEVSVPS